MEITDWTVGSGCEELLLCRDDASGLRAVIAVHSTKLGPALGGCRLWPYASEADAAADAVRLARGMTYKSAMAGLPYGGGKAVIIGGADALDRGPGREELFRAFGRFVNILQGRYITGIDLGTTVADMDYTRMASSWVTDVTGSLGARGNLTAEMTAYGVYLGIRASLQRAFGGDGSLAGRTVAVQGLGKVGMSLCRYLHEAGAQLAAADLDASRTQAAAAAFGARPVAREPILGEPCDVLAPCALGGVLSDATLPQLNCRIVAGAANNQLAQPRHGEELEALGILYAPDYVLNAGGILTTAVDVAGGTAREAELLVQRIPETLARVFALAQQEGVSPARAADLHVERLLGVQG